MVIRRRCRSNRDRRSSVSASASETYRASGAVGHRQVILRPECRGVLQVGRWHNRVRDRAVVTPPGPHVPNACATVLRRSCSDGVA